MGRRTKTGFVTFRMNSKGKIFKGTGGSGTTTTTTTTLPSTGSWNIKFGSGASFKFGVSHGKVVINGKPVQLLPSDKAQFPAAAGWLRFRFMQWVYYLSFHGQMQLYRFSVDGSCKGTFKGLGHFCGGGHGSTWATTTTTTTTGGSMQVDLKNFIGKAFMFRPFNVGGTFVHVRKGGEVWLDKFDGTRQFLKDTSFAVVHGLAGQGVSFRSAVHDNMYLRHRNHKLYLDKYDGKDLFKKDATFNVRFGLGVGHGGRFGISFESINLPGFFVRHVGARLQISKMDNSAAFKMDSTFQPVTAQVQVSHQTQTVSCGFSCRGGMQQKVRAIAHAKVANRPECAKKCCMTKVCAGFDFNTATKDCWLSAIPWSKVAPTPGAGGRPIANRMTCTRGQAGDESDESVTVDDEDEITPHEGVLVEEDEDNDDQEEYEAEADEPEEYEAEADEQEEYEAEE